MKRINLVLLNLIVFLLPVYSALSQPTNNSQNAPITTISSTVACPVTIITLNITSINLDSIDGVNFELDYDGAVLSYIETNPNHLSGNFHNTNSSMFAYNGDFSILQTDLASISGFKKIRCIWGGTNSSITGVVPTTIGNIAHIVDLTFKYYGGSTSIIFNNSVGLSQACEWGDKNGIAYIDTPTEYFYHDGSVTECNNNIGINNINKSRSDLLITPNPAKETIYIRTKEKGYIYIYNVLGEEVIYRKIDEEDNIINVEGLPEGAYIVKFVGKENVITRKIIIKRE